MNFALRDVGIAFGWMLLASALAVSANAVQPMVSLGQEHALALRSDGTVVAWGSDQFGKLGTGRSIYATTPAMVPGFTGVRAHAQPPGTTPARPRPVQQAIFFENRDMLMKILIGHSLSSLDRARRSIQIANRYT